MAVFPAAAPGHCPVVFVQRTGTVKDTKQEKGGFHTLSGTVYANGLRLIIGIPDSGGIGQAELYVSHPHGFLYDIASGSRGGSDDTAFASG